MVGYDTHHFMALEYEMEYYEDFMRKKLLPERGISLEKVPKKLQAFFERLEAIGWICFSL